MDPDRTTHWNDIYRRKAEAELSWHQDDPAGSLDLIAGAGIGSDRAVIDIGGGTSRLAGALIGRGFADVTVLDLSAVAIAAARDRLEAAGPPGAQAVHWITADITRWQPARRYDLWHDRAVFHFLVEAAARAAYLDRLDRALASRGHALIATFAPDGPDRCSGLPVLRYSPDDLARTLGPGYQLLAGRRYLHRTPWGSGQSFQYSLFRKAGPQGGEN